MNALCLKPALTVIVSYMLVIHCTFIDDYDYD